MTQETIKALVQMAPSLYRHLQHPPTFNVPERYLTPLVNMSCKLESLNKRFKQLGLCIQVDDITQKYGRLFVMLHHNQYVKRACCKGKWSTGLANAMACMANKGWYLEDYKDLARPGLYLQALAIINETVKELGHNYERTT